MGQQEWPLVGTPLPGHRMTELIHSCVRSLRNSVNLRRITIITTPAMPPKSQLSSLIGNQKNATTTSPVENRSDMAISSNPSS